MTDEHDQEKIDKVVNEAMTALIDGAEKHRICAACTIENMLVLLTMNLIANTNIRSTVTLADVMARVIDKATTIIANPNNYKTEERTVKSKTLH